MCAFRDWWGYGDPSDAAMLAGVERLLADPATEFLLGGDPVAGVVQLRYRYGVWKDGEDCCLEDLYVHEEARGAGLGRALVDAAVTRARERGCARMELDVNERNEAARRLYESAGFSSQVSSLGGRNLFMRLPLR
jgi:ribosomal protein S18 acetylase RimI-like enzyme